MKTKTNKVKIGILGKGEIGSAMARICEEGGCEVLVRELDYDQLKGQKIDVLHVSIPEKDNKKFIELVAKNVLELKPKLTIINSSITPGTTRKIFTKTHLPIVHSPVIGLHPHLYESIKKIFPKIIGPIGKKAANSAEKHFKNLGLEVEMYDSPEDSESAKLLDLIYYSWNIIFCKWIYKSCQELNLNFDQVYTKHNQIYNRGYSKLLPFVVRPVLKYVPGPIGGHCAIPDTELFHKYYKTNLTKFILDKNNSYKDEVKDVSAQRRLFLKIREKWSKLKS